MNVEPSIDRGALRAAVGEHYGVALARLAFVPVGFAAVCYTARAGDGSTYFLKLWPEAAPNCAAAARQAAVLRLQRAMAERGLFTRLPVPYATRDGALLAPFGGATLALFPLLGGGRPPTAATRWRAFGCGASTSGARWTARWSRSTLRWARQQRRVRATHSRDR